MSAICFDRNTSAPWFGDTNLCFVDTFSGMVPGRVESAYTEDSPDQRPQLQVKVLVTVSRGGYAKGVTYWFDINSVLDRRTVHIRNGKYSIAPRRVRTSLRVL